MDTPPQIHVLAVVKRETLGEYRDNLAKDPQLSLTLVTDQAEAKEHLATAHSRTDVLVLDNQLGDTFALVKELRQTYPRLLIVLVDREADFGMPGHADELSVDPFQNDDLISRIKRLTEERNLETLRADALPPVRAFAKSLRKAGSAQSKLQAAVEAIQTLGYDYVAYYSMTTTDPPELHLRAQVGSPELVKSAPQQQSPTETLVGWVSLNGQSRTVGPEDRPNHPFIQEKRFHSGACVPVGMTLRFGVILACRQQPNAITQQHVMLLELVAAQLASALAQLSRT